MCASGIAALAVGLYRIRRTISLNGTEFPMTAMIASLVCLRRKYLSLSAQGPRVAVSDNAGLRDRAHVVRWGEKRASWQSTAFDVSLGITR